MARTSLTHAIAVLALATLPSMALARSPTQPAPSNGSATVAPSPTPSTAANKTQTGTTKPPGAALPEGRSRLDAVEDKSRRVDRKAQQSICKC